MKILWTPEVGVIERNPACSFWKRINRNFQTGIENFNNLYTWSIENPAEFWSELWEEFEVIGDKGKSIIQTAAHSIDTKFFPESTLNFAANLLRHAQDPKTSNQTALSFWDETHHAESVTYQELLLAVEYLRGKFLDVGLKKNDVVAAIIPNCPIAVIGMLAATSIGAIWTSCSPDFGESGILDRFGQTEPKILIATEVYTYKKNLVPLREKVASIAERLPSVQHVWFEKDCRDNRCHFETSTTTSPWEQFAFDQPLVILYSSGTTGKPKCIVHRAGGVLLEHVKELGLHVGLNGEDVIFYQTTCGWMMWNLLISSLFFGSKLILYDGFPLEHRGEMIFEIAEKEHISVFGTNAKWLSVIQKFGLIPKHNFNLSSIHTVLSTGSPLSAELFEYVYRTFHEKLCLSSISGGTDILGCFALGTRTLPVVAGELQTRSLGMEVAVWDENHCSVVDQAGELVCLNPFPSQPLCFWDDAAQEKILKAYYPYDLSVWTHGDFVALTSRGSMVFYGRSDAVLNPGGVRIGTAEIYAQVEKIPEIEESLVVGKQIEGDIEIILFVRLHQAGQLTDALKNTIKKIIRSNTTAFHVPRIIVEAPDIPKTKNGKTVELAVTDILNGRRVRNTDSLQNPESLAFFYRYAGVKQ